MEPNPVSSSTTGTLLSRRLVMLEVALVAILLGLGILLTWPAMQDDALIHLRYANSLLHFHRISYDGAQANFGDSSLLYVAVLALFRSVVPSPLLPRFVASVSHVLLFAGVIFILRRISRDKDDFARLFALILLLLLALPSSIRWLDDGMETPLVLIVTVVIAMAVLRYQHITNMRWTAALKVALLSFLAVLLRIELMLLLAVASLLSILAHQPPQPGGYRAKANLLFPMSCLCGVILAVVLIFVSTGHLLPDTAVAKSFGLHAWRGTLAMSAETFASSLGFGMGLLLLWLLSFAAQILFSPSLVSVLVANSLFPITLLLATLRGQAIQGIRYFAWTFLFSILWNIFTLPSVSRYRRAFKFSGYALIVVLVFSIPVETYLLVHTFNARIGALNQFRRQNLERLNQLPAVAFDVGDIGYFTGASICDMAGLVNGRSNAELTYDQRVVRCASQNPQFAFLNPPQLVDFSTHFDLSNWSVCSVYNLANLRSSDLHYLIASPVVAGQVCAAANATPQPLEPILAQYPGSHLSGRVY